MFFSMSAMPKAHAEFCISRNKAHFFAGTANLAMRHSSFRPTRRYEYESQG